MDKYTEEMRNLKIRQILDEMSLEDKIALCSGKDFWHTKAFEQYGIPSIMMTDGPHGLRKQSEEADMLGINQSEPATCFPTAVTLGESWNRDLIRQVAEAIGEEARAYDVSVVLGPGINIKRNPLCGRNFEYFSEDPFAAGEMGAAYVEGMQSTGTGCSLKHFAANNQEYKRFSSDSQIDERTLREIYLAGFERVVRNAQPKTVMCSYNKINGVYNSDNYHLLTEILREEWKFKGMVVTDWGAMNDRANGFSAGCDLSMPGGAISVDEEAMHAIREGRLSEDSVDRCAARVLKLVFDMQKNREQHQETITQTENSRGFDETKHHELARKAAEEGIVLLKNENHVLPLNGGEKILILGHMAKDGRYQGAGSSHIHPTMQDQFLPMMPEADYLEVVDEKGHLLEGALDAIDQTAGKYDKVIVFAGLPSQYESEGFDRDTLDLPVGHKRMIDEATLHHAHVVFVLMGGSVMEIPYQDRAEGIVYAGLSGQASGSAIYDVLTGAVNPSGKLTETWVRSLKDVPSYGYYAGVRKNAQYREGIYVGYRYYDKAGVSVNFPFGFGLSYTDFVYSDLKILETDKAEYQYEVSVSIKNTGSNPGAEIVQLYIGNPQDGIFRAIKELKGFEKIYLEPGEEKTVTMMLDARSFAVFQDKFIIPSGKYTVMVGASSADIRLKKSLIIEGVTLCTENRLKGSWYEAPAGHPSLKDWSLLLGREVKEDRSPVKGEFTSGNTLSEMKDFSFIARKMCEMIEKQIAKKMGMKPDYSNPEFRMMVSSSVDCSLHGMIVNSGGAFPKKIADMILAEANHGKAGAFMALIRKEHRV
ncbi:MULTISPECIES: beta-glucosidase [unclassified Bilifractor]|uniref:beta-glucosidase n=1 Tax=unclassified Bilifractor TaxID=2815795 RepID=UPI003F8ED7DC